VLVVTGALAPASPPPGQGSAVVRTASGLRPRSARSPGLAGVDGGVARSFSPARAPAVAAIGRLTALPGARQLTGITTVPRPPAGVPLPRRGPRAARIARQVASAEFIDRPLSRVRP